MLPALVWLSRPIARIGFCEPPQPLCSPAATRDLDTFASFGVFSMGVQVGSNAPANAIAGSGVAVSAQDFVASNATPSSRTRHRPTPNCAI